MITRKEPPYRGTEVSVEKSKLQIDKLLKEYGVTGIRWTEMFTTNEVILEFTFGVEVEKVEKQLSIKVSPPPFFKQRRTYNPKTGRHDIVEAPNWAQGFRVLFFWLKSKLEAISYGLVSAEQEFLSNVVVKLPSGESTTVGAALTKQVTGGRLQLTEEQT